MTGRETTGPGLPGNGRTDVAAADFERLVALLTGRYSCRAFEPACVPRHTIERILDAAQRTASWCNAQPWTLFLASGSRLEGLRQAMVDLAPTAAAEPDLPWPSEYRGVYQERRRECGWGLYESLGIARGDRVASAAQAAENFRMFGAPHVAIVTSDAALGSYGAIDCGAYVGNFMLAAWSLGVASIAQASLAAHPRLLREHLEIPDDRIVVCGISFGYADQSHPANRFRTRRADPDDCVVWRD
jgi:nitroreductase